MVKHLNSRIVPVDDWNFPGNYFRKATPVLSDGYAGKNLQQNQYWGPPLLEFGTIRDTMSDQNYSAEPENHQSHFEHDQEDRTRAEAARYNAFVQSKYNDYNNTQHDRDVVPEEFAMFGLADPIEEKQDNVQGYPPTENAPLASLGHYPMKFKHFPQHAPAFVNNAGVEHAGNECDKTTTTSSITNDYVDQEGNTPTSSEIANSTQQIGLRADGAMKLSTSPAARREEPANESAYDAKAIHSLRSSAKDAEVRANDEFKMQGLADFEGSVGHSVVDDINPLALRNLALPPAEPEPKAYENDISGTTASESLASAVNAATFACQHAAVQVENLRRKIEVKTSSSTGYTTGSSPLAEPFADNFVLKQSYIAGHSRQQINTPATLTKSGPDVGNTLLITAFNLVIGLISAVHAVFMQWCILYLVGAIVLVDFNDLLREDLERFLDGEPLDTASPGFIILIVWGLESLVAVTLAMTYQGRDAGVGILEWAWGVAQLAASPFFVMDGAAFITIVLYLMGYLGVQTVSYIAETSLGKTIMCLTQLSATMTIIGPSAMRMWKKCFDAGRLSFRRACKAKFAPRMPESTTVQ